jgi:hypothetical protein
VQGYLYTLASTPRQMIRRDPHVNYKKMIWMARDAERRGARIFGLGAFTSVVGDAGVTVAQAADIAVTTGNSLTVAATLEGAKQAVRRMGVSDLSQSRTMVVGATGSIGAVCSRLLAQDMKDVTLVAPRPERLIALKRQIEQETPDARVTIATSPDDYVAEMDLIITTTSAFGQRVIDVTRCKPGAVICDVARPPDIEKWEAELRPDISGDRKRRDSAARRAAVGLQHRAATQEPPTPAWQRRSCWRWKGVSRTTAWGATWTWSGCARSGNWRRSTALQLAGMRSFDKYVTDEQLEERRVLAAELRADPATPAPLSGAGALEVEAWRRASTVAHAKLRWRPCRAGNRWGWRLPVWPPWAG